MAHTNLNLEQEAHSITFRRLVDTAPDGDGIHALPLASAVDNLVGILEQRDTTAFQDLGFADYLLFAHCLITLRKIAKLDLEEAA